MLPVADTDADQPAPAPGPDRRRFLGALALGLGTAACAGPAQTHPSPGSQAPQGQAAPSHPGAATSGGAGAGTPAPTPAPSAGPATEPSIARTAGPDIDYGPRTRQEVALTFHGQGPADLTDAVLAECRTAGAAITVFAVGTWLHADPSLGRAIRAAGHELGNHTWSHQQMPSLSASAATSEVARGAAALRAAVGTAGWWFRPSGTRHSTATIRAAARQSGYQRCVSYDVDPEDFLDPGATLVRSRTRRAVRPGSVVSLHLGHAGTVEALPGILSDLSQAGLRPVTLSTLLRD